MRPKPLAERRVPSCFGREKGISRIKILVRGEKDTETSMPTGEGPIGARCVQKSDDSRFCNSHCLSHFAAFFIVRGTKISADKNCSCFVFSFRGLAQSEVSTGW